MAPQKDDNRKGFTVVELLIVIVIIGILAAIVIVSFANAQASARTAKVRSDLTLIDKAIQGARVNQSKVLYDITGSSWTSSGCVDASSGTNLKDRSNSAVDQCWVRWANFTDKVSIASGINIRSILDPYGRPYYVDENENQNGTVDCTKDAIGACISAY